MKALEKPIDGQAIILIETKTNDTNRNPAGGVKAASRTYTTYAAGKDPYMPDNDTPNTPQDVQDAQELVELAEAAVEEITNETPETPESTEPATVESLQERVAQLEAALASRPSTTSGSSVMTDAEKAAKLAEVQSRIAEINAGEKGLSKSAIMRQLVKEGWKRGDIARGLDVRYQFVYNVTKNLEPASEPANA